MATQSIALSNPSTPTSNTAPPPPITPPKVIWSIKPTCGIEVTNLPLGQLTSTQLSQVKTNLSNHGVVYFRNIGADNNATPFTPPEHVQFAQKFGAININNYFTPLQNHSEIAVVEKLPHQQMAVGDGMHTDHSYELSPACGSILVARQVPKEGGDTVFVDMSKAYESLPISIKHRINTMRAVHSSEHIFGRPRIDAGTGKPLYNDASALKNALQKTTTHPVVIKHPTSGKTVLFVNPAFTTHFEGMTCDESKQLLNILYTHALQPQHMHRFKWSPNSAVFWDNRAVWHCAMNDYAGQHRLMHRITIDGEPLEPAFPNLCDRSIETGEQDKRDPFNTVHWPYSILDMSYVQLMQESMETGMNSVAYTGAYKWWELRWWERTVVRGGSFFGMNFIPLKLHDTKSKL